MLDGILIVNKPSGMTSHDVVNEVRKIFSVKKVGHTGTLDPEATGVLPICIGRATRLAEYLSSNRKEYVADMIFGAETDTQDHSGQVVKKCSLPSADELAFLDVLRLFIGEQKQIPPIYSAIKLNGQPLYKMARQGNKPEAIKPRQIEIYDLHCEVFTKEHARIRVACSKGTYIRTLCTDIARTMGSCGHMSRLTRIASGDFTLSQAIPLEELKCSDHPDRYVRSMMEAVSHYPQVCLSNDLYEKIKHGQKIIIQDMSELDETETMIVSFEGRLCSIGSFSGGVFKPHKVFVT